MASLASRLYKIQFRPFPTPSTPSASRCRRLWRRTLGAYGASTLTPLWEFLATPLATAATADTLYRLGNCVVFNMTTSVDLHSVRGGIDKSQWVLFVAVVGSCLLLLLQSVKNELLYWRHLVMPLIGRCCCLWPCPHAAMMKVISICHATRESSLTSKGGKLMLLCYCL